MPCHAVPPTAIRPPTPRHVPRAVQVALEGSGAAAAAEVKCAAYRHAEDAAGPSVYYAVLCCIVLCYAVLFCAILYYAMLCG